MKIIKKLLIVFVILGLIALYMLMNLREETAKIDIKEIDFSTVKDGSYQGNFEFSPIKVVTKSTIKDGKIQKIQILKHENGLGKEAEKIVDSIIEKQSLQVDTISGATTSSKAILKSIESSLGGQYE